MGEMNQSGTSLFQPSGGSSSTITNANGATWNLSVSDNRYHAYSDSSSTLNFVNEGILSKVNAAGRVNFGITSGTQNFTNAATGELTVSGGEFWFRNRLGAGSFAGTVTIGTTGSLLFNDGNHTFEAGVTITGEGKLKVESNQATVTLTDPHSLNTVEIKHGTLNSVGALTAANFTHTNGTFSSGADLTVTDTLLINGGNPRHSGSGTTIIADGATGNLTSGDLYLNGGRNFINNGEVTQSGNMTIRTELGSSSTITNPLGKTWTLNDQNGNYFAHADSSSQLTFDNAGTLIRTSSGTTNFGWQGSTVLNNTGTMDFSTVPGSLFLRSTSVATFGSSSVLTVKMSTSTVAVQGDTIANFDGSLILVYDGTPPSAQAIRTFNYDARNGSTFNTITPPAGASISVENYDDTTNNGRLEITFN
jgi:hypothetical protein